MKWFYRFSLAVFIIWIIVVVSWVYCIRMPLFEGDMYYNVLVGTTAKHIGRDLSQKTKLPFYFPFRVFLYLVDRDRSIQAGEYFFPKGSTLYVVIHRLVTGDVIYYNWTVVNGWNFYQVMQSLKTAPMVTKSLIKTTPKEIAVILGIRAVTPEGWIYPDTYRYSRLATDVSLLKKAHEKMMQVLQEEWANRAQDLWYKQPEQALIVASLIEKETAVESEKPIIAAVILERLKRQMPLQIDSSVRYGLGPSYEGTLTKKDMLRKTLYNTYLRYGLPPTPISMPDRSSIRAALHPANTNVLYFVSKNDGTHYFSATFKEHHEAVVKYQLHRS